MNTPLYNAINNYKDKKVRFHMPSHGGCGEGLLFQSSAFDITELDFSDNLLCSDGVILQAEELMAKVYGAKRSLLLTQGTTCGLQIAVGVCASFGNKVAVLGEMHKSFWNAAKLFKLTVYVYQDATSLKQGVEENRFAGVFATSPNYLGQVSNLDEIYNLAKKNNAVFVVDAAHGAHFPYSSILPDNAKCDLLLTSMHKTMTVYGGGALVNIFNDNLVEISEYYRSLLHSTSPNYLIMASMDFAREDYSLNGEKDYLQIKELINKHTQVGEFKLLDNEDFSRAVFTKQGYDLSETAKILQDKGIYIEGVIEDKLIFILNKNNIQHFEFAISELEQIKPNKILKEIPFVKKNRVVQAVEAVEFVRVEDCLNRISAGEICVYPPAVPIVYCGQIIDNNIYEYLKENKSKLFGLASGKVVVLK